MEPEKKDRYYPVYDHIMSGDGVLVAFTGAEECMKHVRWLNEEDGASGRGFLIGSLPFKQAVRTADEYGRDLIIDPAVDGSTRFKEEFPEAQKRLTLEGNIVISVGLFGHSDDNEVWEKHGRRNADGDEGYAG